VALLLCLTALAGCSDDAAKKSQESPSSDASSSATGSPSDSASSTPSESPTASTGSTDSTGSSASPSDTPSLPNDRIQAANLHIAILDQNAASTDEEKAVVRAWMAYWQGAADSYYLYHPTDGFTKVARGSARSSVISYLDKVKAKRQRVVGWARDNVTKVDVNGDTATVRDCTKNFTFTVDDEAEPLTRPTPYYDVTGTLRKEQGRWTVTKQHSRALNHSCLS
jgi:hypothetical protein